jgi:hypothetical protein
LVGLALGAVEVRVSEVPEGIVPVGVELASAVGVLSVKVACRDDKVASAVGLALSVAERVEKIVLVGEGTVNVGGSDCGMAV